MSGGRDVTADEGDDGDVNIFPLFQNLGFAPDFVHAAIAPFINDIHRKGASVTSSVDASDDIITRSGHVIAGIRVVSNAGGVNPMACAGAIQHVIKKAGLDLRVAVVTGDDLMPHVRFP